MNTLNDAKFIIDTLIKELNPEKRVHEILMEHKDTFAGKRIHLLSIGKAAWEMASAADKTLGSMITKGLVITKHQHSKGKIADFEIFEAGHPVPDNMSTTATQRAVDLFENLDENDLLLFFISGGGSALFERPIEGFSIVDTAEVTEIMLKTGWDIKMINAVRKRLSLVKAGQFAEIVSPAQINAYIISDVLGDNVEDIASGPVSPVSETQDFFRAKLASQDLTPFNSIRKKETFFEALERKLPKKITNTQTNIIDNVQHACTVAKETAISLGYHSKIITSQLECEASEAARFIGSIVKEAYSEKSDYEQPCCLIFGGETTVHIKGKGLGGRNQEIALTSAIEIKDIDEDVCVFSFGTDGTDGPTDAAGGIITQNTYHKMLENGINPEQHLQNNDSYNALKTTDSLIMSGPTGTNVNDVICVLMRS